MKLKPELLLQMLRPAANCLTTTAMQQPCMQLQEEFRYYNDPWYYEQCGFLDAPLFCAGGGSYSDRLWGKEQAAIQFIVLLDRRIA